MPPQHGKCLKKGTKVLLANGQLVSIEDVCPSVMVTCIDRSNNLSMSKVSAISENGEKEVVELSLKSGRQISCTPNHKFLTVLGWKETSELREGDYIAVPKKTPLQEGAALPFGFASLLGYIVGDGSFGKGNPIVTTVNGAIVEHLRQIAEYHGWKLSQDNDAYHIRSVQRGPHDGRSCQEQLRDFMPAARSSNKRVPECIFKAGYKDLVDFLGAYFNCDGTVTGLRDGVAEYYSVSRDLLSDVQTLLTRLGIYSKIQAKRGQYKGKAHASWRLVINGQDLVAFADSVPVIGSKGIRLQDLADRIRGRRHFPEYEAIPNGWQQYLKTGKGVLRLRHGIRVDKKYKCGTARSIVLQIAELENNEELRKLCNPDIIWERVVKIDPGGVAMTYDLEVKDSHNFIAEGIVTHNSELVSHWFPVWLLEMYPWMHVMLASYQDEYAMRWGRKVRDTITENNNVLRVRIADKSAAANEWSTTAGGGMSTSGTSGAMTGKPAHVLIIDDVIKSRAEAESPTFREKTWEWYSGTARQRLNPLPWAPYSIIIVMATRWHIDDLPGRLEKRKVADVEEAEFAPPWRKVVLPALAEEEDPLGRKPGEALWPEKYPVPVLMATKAEVSPYDWESVYQQRPVLKEGMLFRPEYFREIEVVE